MAADDLTDGPVASPQGGTWRKSQIGGKREHVVE